MRETGTVERMADRMEDADRANWIASNGRGPKYVTRKHMGKKTRRRYGRRRTSK